MQKNNFGGVVKVNVPESQIVCMLIPALLLLFTEVLIHDCTSVV